MMTTDNFQRSRLEILPLLAAVLLAMALLVAAWAKFFHPGEAMPLWWRVFHLSVVLFELIFAVLLLVYHKRWQLWATTALILGSWAGYALFWFCHDLPCGCMGRMFDLPGGSTFAFDLVFVATSLALVGKLHRFSWNLLLGSILAGGFGYLLALFFAGYLGVV